MIIGRQILVIAFLLSFKYCNFGSHSAVHNDFAKSIFVYDTTSRHAKTVAKEMECLFSRLNREGNFNGTVLYAEKGKIIFEGAYGYSNLVSHDSLAIESSFQLASVSKMFTATGIMMLQEQGKLKYDDLVKKYIYDFPYQKVTIRQLLTHRSGLPEYIYLADKFWDQNEPFKNSDLLRMIHTLKPAPYYQPDRVFDYCNTNYAILASIIEVVSGEDYETFIKQKIFEPLGMKNSFVYHLEKYDGRNSFVPVGVQGHIFSGRRLVPSQNDYLNGVKGDKGIYSTVRDLYIYDRALYSDLLLSKNTIAEAFTPGSPYRGSMNNYGFGWRMKKNIEGVVYHFGWWKGFRAYFIRDIKNERVMIVLTNTQKGINSGHLWKLLGIDKYSKTNAFALK